MAKEEIAIPFQTVIIILITHLRQPEILLERNRNILNCKEIVSGA